MSNYYIYSTNSYDAWSQSYKSFDFGRPVQDVVSDGSGILFASCPVYNYSDGSVYCDAFGSFLTQEEAYLEAVAYLGETAQGIQNGTITEDNLDLPEYINVSEFFANISDSDGIIQNYNQISQDLQTGERSYEDFVQSITASNPSTGDNTGTGSGSGTGTGTGDGTGGTTGGTTNEPVSDIAPYGLNLKDYFPFCIPFDLYDFFSVLAAEPEAPKFHWEIQDLSGNIYPIDVDLSPWDSVAQLVRRLELLLFIVGLATASRKFIKW